MNNSELIVKFNEINKLNAFDAEIALRAFKKEYKKSEFYKQTHISCSKAYALYNINKLFGIVDAVFNLFDAQAIADKISDIIDGIDRETVRKFSDRLVDGFGGTDLNNLKGELKVLLNQVKDIAE